MSSVIGNRGILAAALAVASSMPLVGGSVLHEQRFANAQASLSAWTPRSGRARLPGKHQPAGAKLWRKAREGKLGVRW